MDKLLNRKEMARLLNVSLDTVDSLASKGELKRLKIGNRTLFAQEEAKEFVDRLVRKGAISIA